MNTFSILLLILMLWTSAYAIYFNLIRPVIMTRVNFWVREVSDEIDMVLIAGKVARDDPAVKILRSRVEKATHWLPLINLTNMLMEITYEDRLLPKPQVEAEDKTIQEASPEIKILSEKLDRAVIAAFCTNSPFLISTGVMLVLGAALFSSLAVALRATLTKGSWQAIYDAEIPGNRKLIAC